MSRPTRVQSGLRRPNPVGAWLWIIRITAIEPLNLDIWLREHPS
jgi:hypothetical protein